MSENIPRMDLVDIVGVGLNATDTVIHLPRFPTFNSKVEFVQSEISLGGQVATAIMACARWGMSARYVGRVGDDAYAQLQRQAMGRASIESHWITTPNCASQSSFILLDEPTGERTILWKRDPRLELKPEDLRREWIIHSKLLHVDGHDCAAATTAARWAREAGIPVTADLDNRYPGVEALLEHVDYIICSMDFPARITGEDDLLRSLPILEQRFKCKVAAATIGADGAIAWDGLRFHYCPAFAIKPVDTTGAGDIFHAAFAYSLVSNPTAHQSTLRTWDLAEALEFGCAAAALSCLKVDARGGIPTLQEIEKLMRTGARGPAAYSPRQLSSAGVGG